MSTEVGRTRSNQNQDLQYLQEQYRQRRDKLVEQQEEDLKSLRENYQKKEEDIKNRGDATINQLQKSTQDSITETRVASDQKIQNDRIKSQKAYEDFRRQNQVRLATMKRESEAHSTQNQNNEDWQKEREKQTKVKEQLRSDYDQEIADIHHRGDAAVTKENNIFRDQLVETRASHAVQQEELEEKQNKEIKEIQSRHQQKMEKNEQIHRQMLNQQKEEFEEKFNQNHQNHQNILREQKLRLAAGMMEQKKEAIQTLGKYIHRQDDPFYRLQTTDAFLKDYPGAYTLEIDIPEENKDEVRVIVKDDRLIVSGKRRFKDDVQEEGHRITTNSQQTFREEIPLSQPVLSNEASQQYRNGTLKVFIPKAGIETTKT